VPPDGTPDSRPTQPSEAPHRPGAGELWGESWYFDFALADASLGGYVRLELYPNAGSAWFWAFVAGDGRPLVAVRDHEVPLPRGRDLEVRSEGLWSALNCEEPHEHWSIGLEAFAVAMDDPEEALGSEVGDRVALGLDLEWEATSELFVSELGSGYEQSCRVIGEVLVGAERIAFNGHGQRDHSWARREWWSSRWFWMAGRLADGRALYGLDARSDSCNVSTGYVSSGHALTPVEGFSVDTQRRPGRLPVAASVSLGGLGVQVSAVSHAPIALVDPLGRTSVLARSLCAFTATDGAEGAGWAAWLRP
jgi:hypothetical protein